MNQVDTCALVIINLISVLLFGRIYFGSLSKTIIAFIHFLRPKYGIKNRLGAPDSEPSELLFFFMCVILIIGEMMWLFSP